MENYFAIPSLGDAELSLRVAASRGDVRAALAAIALGAHPDARGDDPLSSTALMIAAKMGRLGVLEALLPHCDARLTDSNGHTALMLCAMAPGQGALDGMRALIPHSDPRSVDRAGRDALAAAASRGKADCCTLLAPLSDPKRQGLDGRSALSWAAACGSTDCCSLLAPLSDLDAVETFTGMNAADLARRNGHVQAAQVVEACRERLDLAGWIPDGLLGGVLVGQPRI